MKTGDTDTMIATITPGDTISYKLLPKDQPCHPDKVWHGKVLRGNAHSFYVEVLEPGYYNLKEYVRREQIIAVEN